LVFGGWSDYPLNDVWSLSLSDRPTWSRLDVAGTAPPGRWFSSAIYDPAHDAMVIFGGRGSGPLDDAWSLSLGGAPAWHRLEPSGPPPGVRWGHSANYDPVRRRMLVFGGSDGTLFFNDLWALSLGDTLAWEQVSTPRPRPGGRVQHSMIY